jgi:hypothetical protein
VQHFDFRGLNRPDGQRKCDGAGHRQHVSAHDLSSFLL